MSRKKPVLVTGGSGFIAKHIIRQLLDEGFEVRASVRSSTRETEVRQAMAAHVKETVDLGAQLSFVHLDLSIDDGWSDALAGVSALMHTASPFPMIQPDDEDEIIKPAVEGTMRALVAAEAAGVSRVILTSSIVAIVNKRLAAGRNRYNESDWSELNSPYATPYVKSKTMAEKAAWSFAKDHPDIKLTTINPALVLGPALDDKISTSVQIVQRLMNGKDPMVPNIGFPVVDVRDVATMHVRALQRPESAGARFISAERFIWMQDIARILKSEYPDRRIPTRLAPDFLVKLLSLFDKAIKSAVPILGVEQHLDNAAACEVLGMEFIEARQAVKSAAAGLIRDNLVS
ncbi:MAG: aldehyde reductase [Rhodobacteraceae bacterium]|nr:aldehyde reductase [Paracoccaceae bacterium]